MKKKQIIYLCTLLICFIAICASLLCYYLIPRITYAYDKETESYYVDKVYGNAKSYTIASYVHSKPVTKIRARAFMNKTKMQKVILSETIVEVERMSFKGCKRLKEVNLNNVEKIGRNAFQNCVSLEQIELQARYIDGAAFMECHHLSSVLLKRTSIIGSYAFAYTNIEEIVIPSTCHTLGVDAFYACDNLKKIVVHSPHLKNNAYLNTFENIEFVD